MQLKIRQPVLLLLALLFLACCSSSQESAVQPETVRVPPHHENIIDSENFLVFGRVLDKNDDYAKLAKAAVAYPDKFAAHQYADSMFFKAGASHYGLHLPEGRYTIVIYADINGDGHLSQSEAVGQRKIILSKTSFQKQVQTHVDIHLTAAYAAEYPLSIMVPEIPESLFFPAGSIRSLDDLIFEQEIATLGIYNPAAFMDIASGLFYALEEESIYKIPVIFVHGTGETAKTFAHIISHLDRDRYQPWFFYYPSGVYLEQLAALFYKIYLSGTIIAKGDTPLIVVAHRAGAVIVRQAVNHYQNRTLENKVKLVVTINDPLADDPLLNRGEKSAMSLLSAWDNLHRDPDLLKNIYQKPLPEFVSEQVFYELPAQNTDSLLNRSVYTQRFAFNSGYTPLIENEEMITSLMRSLNQVKNPYPQAHIQHLARGGYDVNLSSQYDPFTQYIIHSMGKYIIALAHGIIEPNNPDQVHFVRVVKGEETAASIVEMGLIKFMREYSEIIDADSDFDN
ncbi:hypothetical protein [Psychromonas aquimarina]|uniref:hypothetical protein n=1 Tax=Psychromonas aquimarina TaxID=444919 RepID=UPI0003F9AA3C|nr:hypothetical protein [Psychromonas aquimarina]